MTSLSRDHGTILRFPVDQTKAVDSLNLCEFPLAVLSDRAPKDTFELSFTDQLWDDSAKKRIDRTLCISAPSKYGLPTAKDEEILLALIHYTDQINQFSSPTVHFSRYELIKLLGWDEGGKSYQRIRDSLARWKSVTFDYGNAWRNHRAQSWVSEIFSIIDNVTIYDREQQRAKANNSDQIDLPLSSFTWNRIFFESMQAKYFKRLDFGFYQQLSTPTAKRLFRFLDKRFGSGRNSWEFELREFAFQHIGLSRSYDTGKIKEKLMPSICELEEKGFIATLAKQERFTKRGKEWRVRFSKRSNRACGQTNSSATDLQATPLHKQLTDRGVSPKAAAELVGQVNDKDIESQLDIFDWLMERHSDRLKNPAGFLAESIRSGFKPPSGYQTKDQREMAKRRSLVAEEAQKSEAARLKAKQEREQAKRDHVKAMRASLSDDELSALEKRVIANADPETQVVLNNPTFRETQIAILVDQILEVKMACT